MRRPAAIVTVVLVVVLWVAALVVAPSSASYRHPLAPRASALVYAAGALVCHQRPERSFHRDGAQFPVCARCLGLYVGGLLGVFAWAGIAGLGGASSMRAQRIVSSNRLRLALVLSALPTVVSVVTALLGLWDPENTLRATLSLPLGMAVGTLVCAVAARDLR